MPVIKTIRFPHLEKVENLSPDLDIYTIFLVRDPRGVFNSRAKIYLDEKRTKFSKRSRTQLINDINLMCLNINKMLGELKSTKNVLLIRYEDIAMNSTAYASRIFDFVKMNFESSIENWVKTQLELDNDGANGNRFTTNKNPTQVALRWREEISLEDVQKIQELVPCQKAMASLGYLNVEKISNTSVVLERPKTV